MFVHNSNVLGKNDYQQLKQGLMKWIIVINIYVSLISRTSIGAVFYNRSFDLSFHPTTIKSLHYYLTPISAPYFEKGSILFESITVGENIVQLIPLGFLAPIIWGKVSRLRNVLLLGLFVSICSKVLYMINLKFEKLTLIASIDDVLCNVLGVFLGHFIYKLMSNKMGKFVFKRM